MRRAVPMSLVVLALTFRLAAADPGVRVTYVDGTPQIQLDGSYSGSSYTVFRADTPSGTYRAITNDNVLCLGDCYARDFDTVPGHTYYYRFDLTPAAGNSVSFGPYAVVIPGNPVRASLSPNPSRGVAHITLSLPGSVREAPSRADVRILDVQGRTIRLLQNGLLSRGTSTLTWDGRGDNGQELRAGLYFLRLSTPLGNSITRVVRVH